MKKSLILLACVPVLLSCSLGSTDLGSVLFGQATETPTAQLTLQPAASATSAATPTVTATRPTPTFTGTPTFINFRPSATPTDTPLSTGTFGILTTNQATIVGIQQLLTSQSPAFDKIVVSGNQILWGSCQPASVKISVHVTSSTISSILFFTRLQDALSSFVTDWNGGANMNNDGGGAFSYVLTPKSISRYRDFKKALVEYQMVAFTNKREVGRTQIFTNNITIGPCQ